jgi:hypothetical protein
LWQSASSFHPLGDFLNPALALLGQGLKKSPIGQKLDFANHPYLCKGLNLTFFITNSTPLLDLRRNFMIWTDSLDIAIALDEAHPELDPTIVNFVDLRDKV